MDTTNPRKKHFYFDTSDPAAAVVFGDILRRLVKQYAGNCRSVILLCIGTDRATGDCLGPLLGYKLRSTLRRYPIYGDLDRPVHAKNLHETLEQIHRLHRDPFIIAIDASLGEPGHIGYYTLGLGPLKPGAGTGKELPAVGHLCITGIVDHADAHRFSIQTTRLNTVMALADNIHRGLCLGLNSGEPLQSSSSL